MILKDIYKKFGALEVRVVELEKTAQRLVATVKRIEAALKKKKKDA